MGEGGLQGPRGAGGHAHPLTGISTQPAPSHAKRRLGFRSVVRAAPPTEDAVIEALIAGATFADLEKIDATNVATPVLSDYVTEANMRDIPDGMSFIITASVIGSRDAFTDFHVWIEIDSDASHAAILDELQAMMPKTVNHLGLTEWVRVDAKDLAIQEAESTP